LRRLIETSQGEVVCGGAEGVDQGKHYLPPTIISRPSLDAPVMQEEIFGPVLPVIPFKTLDEALELVGGQETPLALYIYSQSSKNVERILANLPSGGCCVNSSMEHILQHELPFGGSGPSGMGAYHGKFGFDELSHRRSVLRKSTLPFARSPALPLPTAGKPVPDAVYSVVTTMTLGVVPMWLKRTVRKTSVKRIAAAIALACLACLLILLCYEAPGSPPAVMSTGPAVLLS